MGLNPGYLLKSYLLYLSRSFHLFSDWLWPYCVCFCLFTTFTFLPVIKSFFQYVCKLFFNVWKQNSTWTLWMKVSLQKPISLEKCHGHGHFQVTQSFSMTAGTLVGLIMWSVVSKSVQKSNWYILSSPKSIRIFVRKLDWHILQKFYQLFGRQLWFFWFFL